MGSTRSQRSWIDSIFQKSKSNKVLSFFLQPLWIPNILILQSINLENILISIHYYVDKIKRQFWERIYSIALLYCKISRNVNAHIMLIACTYCTDCTDCGKKIINLKIDILRLNCINVWLESRVLSAWALKAPKKDPFDPKR